MTDRAPATDDANLRPQTAVEAHGRAPSPRGPYAASLKRRILFITSEMSDYVKVGGLGEVSSALPRALSSQFDVRVLIPGYREVLARHADLAIVCDVPASAGLPGCKLGLARCPDGLEVYVLVSPELYERDGTPYGDGAGSDWGDNDVRFGRLCAAAAQIALGEADPSWSADLVHANDWPSALTSAYLRWSGRNLPSVLTVHNLAYQGLFPRACLPSLGVPENAFQIEGVEFYDKLSFLKAGLFYADHITTVSANYAREITTEQHGCGLDGLLRQRAAQGRLTGIVNGIDDAWNPAVDEALAAPFEAGDWGAKRINTNAVRKEFGLAVSRGPLFAVVSRLVHQKGIDFVIGAADRIVANGGQLVVIGRGEPQIEQALEETCARHPQSLSVRVGYEEAQARRIFAGADFLLMPSRFEPCGLSQMFAQRAGALPIVHRTGGLADTVQDGVTGFHVTQLTVDGLLAGVRRAFNVFAQKTTLARMRTNAMAQKFSWSNSAADYGALYLRGIGNRPG
ncbi:MAG: glgA [Hyphomicrobiales bacterium]|nr:glgA [Hyphomicrobiales bacterium]